MGTTDRLFMGVYPTGIAYADRAVEVDGDYKPVAFLVFATLAFEARDPTSPLLDEAREDAAKIQARRGQPYEVSACKQTITLGRSPARTT